MADKTLRVFKQVHRRALATDPEYVKKDLDQFLREYLKNHTSLSDENIEKVI
jgi:hemerythrin